MASVDFLYRGEANVLQENLDSFLAIAEELQLKGLVGRNDRNVENTIVDVEVDSKQAITPLVRNRATSETKRKKRNEQYCCTRNSFHWKSRGP